ncbi:MAG TPA: Mut7-C RNAse domain-containing protein [candidate division Zixibacteria bacterium]|nr:Mut7-C RNAse domain-containing protein [candidate division Zixibacteria bacterium]
MSVEGREGESSEVRFAADRMLGKLVKWLRVIGQDVIYGPHLSGYGLIRAARREHRTILTRDRKLARKHPPELIFIASDRYPEQLRQVIEHCRLDPFARAFSRCLECNALLRPLPKESVEALVPPYVFATQEQFSGCPVCRRVFWRATHHEKMLAELKKITGG